MAQKTLKKRPSKDKVPSVVRKIRPVEVLDEKRIALFYGKAGAGKTETASTFPTPILYIDINNEKGLATIAKKKDIDVAKARTWKDLIELFWWLRDGQKYETIVLDQITSMQDLGMAEIRRRRKKDPDELFTQKNWGELSGELKTWLQSYRELSDLYNMVFIAHLREFGGGDEMEDNEIDPSVSARVMPSVADYIEGACDIIGQSFVRVLKKKKDGKIVKRTEYCMRIGPHPVYVTKIRRPSDAGKLPEFIVNPTYRKLVAIENGEDIQPNVRKVKKEKARGKKFKKL